MNAEQLKKLNGKLAELKPDAKIPAADLPDFFDVFDAMRELSRIFGDIKTHHGPEVLDKVVGLIRRLS